MTTPCTTVNPEVFFNSKTADQARSLCQDCPLSAFTECRRLADDDATPHGVYAGETGAERIGRLIRERGPSPRLWEALRDAVGSTTANSAARQSGLPLEVVCKGAGLRAANPKRNGTDPDQVAADKRRIIELAEQGYSRSEIVKLTGFSESKVSRHGEGHFGAYEARKAAEREQLRQTFIGHLDAGWPVRDAATKAGCGGKLAKQWAAEWRAADPERRRARPGQQRDAAASMPSQRVLGDAEKVRQLTAEGKSKAEIAAITGLATSTVGRHRKLLTALAQQPVAA